MFQSASTLCKIAQVNCSKADKFDGLNYLIKGDCVVLYFQHQPKRCRFSLLQVRKSK
jgi:hypothetical protein